MVRQLSFISEVLLAPITLELFDARVPGDVTSEVRGRHKALVRTIRAVILKSARVPTDVLLQIAARRAQLTANWTEKITAYNALQSE